jgi:phage-related protein
MSTFTHTPEFGASKQLRPRVTAIKFGDGYEQRVAQGLNTKLEVWNLNFVNRTETEANEIDDFLIARGGVESFDWTPPDSATSKKFVCREWTRVVLKANLYSIAATFEQVMGV